MNSLDVATHIPAPGDIALIPEAAIALCCFTAGAGVFGIDTRTIKEVLTKGTLRRVPLAPRHVCGVLPYRGDVLTTVSLRTLLGLPPFEGEGSVVVLDGDEHGEQLGLLVDSIGSVVIVDPHDHQPSPSTLDDKSSALYDGVFRRKGLIILLTSRKLRLARVDQAIP